MNFIDSKFGREIEHNVKKAVKSKQLDEYNKRIQRNIDIIKERQQPKPPEDGLSLLLANIVLDYLRLNNLNYTYSVFLKESNTKTQYVVLHHELIYLLPLKYLYRLSLDLQHPEKSALYQLFDATYRLIREDTEVATQTIEHSYSFCPSYYDRKVNMLKQELESIHKKERELWEDTEKIKIKQEITLKLEKYYEEKLQKFKKDQVIRQTKSIPVINDETKYQNYELISRLATLSSENSRLRYELQNSLMQLNQHRCYNSQSFIEQMDRNRKREKELKELEREYKQALSNINTNVEDLIYKKNQILHQNKHYLIAERLRKGKGMDDQVAKALLAAVSNMEARVSVLAYYNQQLREYLQNSSKKVVQLDRYLSSIQKYYVNNLSLEANSFRMESRLPSQTRSIGIYVRYDMFEPDKYREEQENLYRMEKESEQEREELARLLDEMQKKKLESIKNVNRLRLDMGRMKKKVRMLIEDDFY